MPANPGKNRAAEKQKKKRAAAQLARKQRQAATRARQAAQAAEAPEEASDDLAPQPFATGAVDYDALDAANEEIGGLLKKKKLDEAEKKARKLASDFPKHSDGLQLLAKVHEARGDKKKAIEALREALTRPNDGDEEVHETIEKELERLGA